MESRYEKQEITSKNSDHRKQTTQKILQSSPSELSSDISLNYSNRHKRPFSLEFLNITKLTLAFIMKVPNCITVYQGWLLYLFGFLRVKADLSRSHCVHITPSDLMPCYVFKTLRWVLSLMRRQFFYDLAFGRDASTCFQCVKSVSPTNACNFKKNDYLQYLWHWYELAQQMSARLTGNCPKNAKNNLNTSQFYKCMQINKTSEN